MRKVLAGIFAVVGFVSSVAVAELPSNFEFIHPGVTFNTEDLERMKNNRDIEPWKTGYEILINDSKSSYDYTIQGPFETVSRNGDYDDEYNDDMDSVFINRFNITLRVMNATQKTRLK